jgi:hypothetical protein
LLVVLDAPQLFWDLLNIAAPAETVRAHLKRLLFPLDRDSTAAAAGAFRRLP